MRYEKTYQHLMSLQPEFTVVPTVADVNTVVEGLRAGHSMDAILAELTGWAAQDCAHLVEGLGKFLSQSSKTKVNATLLDWDKSGTMFYAPSQAELETERQRKLANPRAGKKGTSTDFIPDGTDMGKPVVYLPPGWTKSELGKSIAQSLATVVLSPLGEEQVERFISRYYASTDIQVSASHVHILLWLAENGMLERLNELGQANYPLANVLARAWQTLNVWSEDGWKSFQALSVAVQSPEVDAQTLLDHCNRAEWMWPAEISRVRTALESVARNPQDPSAVRLARMRLNSFAKSVNVGHWHKLEAPHELNAAHVHALCLIHGLTGREDEEKTVRAELREWLIEHGFANDLDKEVANGVNAWKLGILAEFYENRADRARGDRGWATAWDAVLATTS